MSASKSVCIYGTQCHYQQGMCPHKASTETVRSKDAKFHSEKVSSGVRSDVGRLIDQRRRPKREKLGKNNVSRNTGLRMVLRHPSYLAYKAKLSARKELFAKYKMDMSTYFDVKTDKDVKLPAANSLFDRELKLMDDELSVLKAAARSAIGGQHIKIKLYYSTTSTSGANAVNSGFYGVTPSASIEWGSLITLYDECRVDSLTVRHLVGLTTSPSANPTGSMLVYAIGYDPTYNTTPASEFDVQESQYQSLHFGASTISFAMAAMPMDGHKFHAKIAKSDVMNSDMKTKPNFPGSWMSCLDTTDTVGYIRYYCSAGGATATTSWYQNMEMNCEFRIRT